MRPVTCLCVLGAVLSAGLLPASADIISFQRITNVDVNDPTHINNFVDVGRTYTHKLDIGPAGTPATINGVAFDQVTATMLSSGTIPSLNLAYSVSNGNVADHPGGTGGGGGVWPPNGVVADSDLANLLNDFSYNSAGTGVGDYQQFVLTGLDTYTDYIFRLYIRPWEGPTGATTRRQDIGLTVGGNSTVVAVNEDRPYSHAPFTNTSDSDAWFLEYRYNTGANTSLAIRMTTQAEPGIGTNGSFHTYGMTNEVVPEPSGVLMLLIAVLALAGSPRRRSGSR